MKGSSWRAVAAIMAAIALALLASPALAMGRGGAPDLVVAAGKLSGDPFVFYGGAHQPNFSLTAVTSNRGAAAGPTVTTVYLEHDNHRRRFADRTVPALGPGASDRGRATVIHEPRLPLGAYTVTICADAKSKVAEANERNNCKKLADHFYVVTTDWTGKSTGTATLGPHFDKGPDPADKSVERAQSSDLDYFFDEYRGEGLFEYELASAHFTFTDEGIDGEGCRHSGGGTSADGGGWVQINYLADTYHALAEVPTFYESHYVCFREGHYSEGDLEAPYAAAVLDTEIFRGPSNFTQDQRLGFGAFKLAGSSSDPELGETWSWSLEAAKP